MQRVSVPELLDVNAGTPQEIADSLEDLRRINRFLGGYATTRALLGRVRERKQLARVSFLDVGGASGVSAEKAEITVLDRDATHLVRATARRVCGDALRLPFSDNAFDVVGSSLLLHHFEPEQIVPFVTESMRVARHAVIINDLRRSPLHLRLAQLGRVIYKSRITDFDAVASVRRAYTPEELAQILRQLPHSCECRNYFFFRMGVLVWK